MILQTELPTALILVFDANKIVFPLAGICKSIATSASLLESWRYLLLGTNMNKVEAAEFLGIGVRSLERYMSQGRIAYTHRSAC